ncbi:hypothetical protein FCM35_KLT00691 [Carex littledalei]|uniref:Uncharacterized protein n=1 Tax=Carex littledalei TaxID=544730 RepID=A0A833RWX5_9POAL|nr:hypothetical protein FCM35_KLT00691 [Carex littledalei]
MATKPPTVATIALTEKKMDMTLDEIISMSKKKNTARGRVPQRAPIKNKVFQNGGPPPKGFKARQFTDSRSAMRQGVLAQRRTNFNGKTNFPATSNIAKKAAAAPIRSRPVRWNQPRVAPAPVHNVVMSNGPVKFENGKKPHTMDALFSSMQKQRRRTNNPQMMSGPIINTNRQVLQQPQPYRQQQQQPYRPQQQQPYRQQQRRPYRMPPVYK